jgi:hypothetical protein
VGQTDNLADERMLGSTSSAQALAGNCRRGRSRLERRSDNPTTQGKCQAWTTRRFADTVPLVITLASAALAAASSSFHLDLGDLPTWLGVIAASIAAYFVYGQLSGQRDDLARQLRALERQQADQVDVKIGVPILGNEESMAVLSRLLHEGRIRRTSWTVMTVRNGSGRPIRQVTGRIEESESNVHERIFLQFKDDRDGYNAALADARRESVRPQVVIWTDSNWTGLSRANLWALLIDDSPTLEYFTGVDDDIGGSQSSALEFVRPSSTGGLVFPISWFRGERFRVRFTDDAGLHWQVDENLHLQKLDNRDEW